MSKSCSIDVRSQLDELRRLENGWYNGKGQKPPEEGLDWLIDSWNRYCPSSTFVPSLVPWVDGTVHGEFVLGQYEIVLKFDLIKHTCILFVFDLADDSDDAVVEYKYNFKQNEHFEWTKFFKKIRQLHKIYL